MSDFYLSIWDRWGGKIYETSDPNQPWNGRYDNTGTSLEPGVYIYKVSYITPRNKNIHLKGYATLIR